MINAMTVAMEFAALLPKHEVPENTEGYEGFAHLVGMQGEIENAVLDYIIRDPSTEQGTSAAIHHGISAGVKIAEFEKSSASSSFGSSS